MDIKWETSPDPHLLRWPVLTISVFSSSHIYLCDTIYCACISGSRFKQYYCLLAMRAGDIAYLDIYTFSLSSPSHFKNNYSMTFSCCYFKIPCNILKSISSINCFISLSTLLSQFITVIPLLLLKVWNIYIICFVTIVNCLPCFVCRLIPNVKKTMKTVCIAMTFQIPQKILWVSCFVAQKLLILDSFSLSFPSVICVVTP